MTGPRFDPQLLYGRSDFGEAEQRLRRLLDLEGLVPLDLGRVITPVMVVADATVPGFGASRLRGFAVSGLPNNVAAQGWWFRCERREGVLIDSISVITAASATLHVRYLGPQDADPVVLATSTGIMVDRSASGAEASPLVRNAVSDASANAAGNVLWTTGTIVPGFQGFGAQLPIPPFFLAFGAKFSVGCGAVAQVSVYGRTF